MLISTVNPLRRDTLSMCGDLESTRGNGAAAKVSVNVLLDDWTGVDTTLKKSSNCDHWQILSFRTEYLFQ